MPKYNVLDSKRTDDLDSIFEKKPAETADNGPETPVQDKSEVRPVTDFYEQPQSEQASDQGMFSAAPGKDAVAEHTPIAEQPAVAGDDLDLEKPVTIQKPPEIDYEDEKQEGINYKPIIIGIIVVVLIIGGYFIVKNFILGGPGKPIPVREKTVSGPDAEKKLKDAKTTQKEKMARQLAAEKQYRVGYISALRDMKVNNVYYSSVLLYGQNLNFEVFSPGREDLARFNMKIKDNPVFAESQLISVDQRPGENGGIFALYDVVLGRPQAGSGSQSKEAVVKAPGEWIKQVARSHKLSLKNSRQLSTKKENLFIVTRMEYTFRGSETACLNFLKQLSTANLNAGIYKLSLIPTNQRNFRNAQFKMDLIVDLYM